MQHTERGAITRTHPRPSSLRANAASTALNSVPVCPCSSSTRRCNKHTRTVWRVGKAARTSGGAPAMHAAVEAHLLLHQLVEHRHELGGVRYLTLQNGVRAALNNKRHKMASHW